MDKEGIGPFGAPRLTDMGPLVSNSGGPPRPDGPPEAGRGEPRTEEEIIEFMDKCMDSKWAEDQAENMIEAITGTPTPDVSDEKLEHIKAMQCAGVISKAHTSTQTVEEIVEVWENR